MNTSKKLIKKLALAATQVGLVVGLSGCAILWHAQVGNLDLREEKDVLVPFEVLLSEMGVSTEDVKDIARASRSKEGENIASIIQMFQIGPRTGNPVYNQRYAENLIYEIHQKCPTGQVTGLVSIREMRKYPVISGEIVKLTGYCRQPKTQESPS